MLHILIVENESNISKILMLYAQGTNSKIQILYHFSGKNALAAKEIATHNLPDITVLNMTLANISPFDVIKELKHKYPEIKIGMQFDEREMSLLISSVQPDTLIYPAAQDIPFTDVIYVIETIHNNSTLIPQHVTAGILNKLKNESIEPINPNIEEFHLTNRENELLQDLAEGLMYKDIASKYTIKITTVNHHIRNIYKKMHVKSRAQAVALLRRRNNGDTAR